jgi:aminoglycoside phosphotransferase (APT) family kinase protein
VLDREPAAVASLRAEIVRRRDLAAQRLAFEVAARLQSELEAIGWIVAEQKAALAEAADYDIRGWADGMLICFGVRGARLCSWTQRACAELSAHPQVAATRRRGPGSLLATPSSPRGWPGHQPSGSWYKKGMAAAEPPGPLVGSGRSADVYALGPGRVLRRFRTPYNAQAEADIMIHLAKAGFPVPAVHDADGPDLVMERLDGRDMLADLSSRPWLARRHGRTLAMLHNRLHQVRAPAGLRTAFGPGDRVLHLDLHPGNVMLTSRGPVVIDWTNASAGAPGADVAMAYLIMASSDTDLLPWWLRPAVRALRAALLGQFRAAAHDNPAPHIARVARGRLTDRNVRPAEAGRLLRMAEQAERAAQAERP